jgi:hypothetical protein
MAKPDQGLIAYESLNGKDCTALQLWKIRLTLPLSGRQGDRGGAAKTGGGLSTQGAC